MSGAAVLARCEARCAAELAALQGLIVEGTVSEYEKELADLTAEHREAAEARAAVDELIRLAGDAENIIRNCVNAGQIGAGYMGHADTLRAALARAKGGEA